MNTITLTSPIFANGSKQVGSNIWSTGLFEMMAVVSTLRPGSEFNRVACDQATVEAISSVFSDSMESFSNMVGSLGAVLSSDIRDELSSRTVQQLGFVIEGLAELHGDIANALSWLQSMPGHPTVADPDCLFDDHSLSAATHPLATSASAETELHAGLHDFRKLMVEIRAVDNGAFEVECPQTQFPRTQVIAAILGEHLRALTTTRSDAFQTGFLLPLAKVVADNADWEPKGHPAAEMDTYWFGDVFRNKPAPAVSARKTKRPALAAA